MNRKCHRDYQNIFYTSWGHHSGLFCVSSSSWRFEFSYLPMRVVLYTTTKFAHRRFPIKWNISPKFSSSYLTRLLLSNYYYRKYSENVLRCRYHPMYRIIVFYKIIGISPFNHKKPKIFTPQIFIAFRHYEKSKNKKSKRLCRNIVAEFLLILWLILLHP